MPFLGKSPTAGFASIVKDDLTPNGSTTAFTLSKQVANANDIAVFLGNVRQEPTDAYTVSGTTLTMSEAPASGLNFYVLHIAGTVESSVVPADGTISSAKLSSGAALANIGSGTITDAKIASGVDASKLTTGDLPIGSFPAGTIIQVVRNVGTTLYSNNSSSTYLNIADINTSITPKAANSILFFQLSGQTFKNGMQNGQSGVQMELRDNTNNSLIMEYRGINFHNASSTSQCMQYFCFNATTSASNTNAREYRLNYRNDESYNAVNQATQIGWNSSSNGPQCMVIYEIAQ
jgi:hypothetical protein